MFVTFRGGVYDVSKFCKSHPGGDLIAQAAGGDVEPFWQKWAYHYHSIKVKHALEELRVGTLHENNNNACESDVMEYGKEDMYKDYIKRTGVVRFKELEEGDSVDYSQFSDPEKAKWVLEIKETLIKWWRTA